MHELSIALSLVELAQEEVHRQGGGLVRAIYLNVGKLSGVVPEALRGAFEMARADTAMRDARLEIEEIPISGRCPACGRECSAQSLLDFVCPVCGSPVPVVDHGRELEMTAMEIES